MLTRMTLMAVGLCFAAAPAMAGDLVPVEGSGPIMLSDTQMDNVVAGEQIVVSRFLRTGKIIGEDPDGNPIYKTIDKPTQGGKQYAGDGPAKKDGEDTKGKLTVKDLDITPPGFPPGLTLTVDGTVVGQPSNGRGAGFITVYLNTP